MEVVFIISVFLIFHSYVLYPFMLWAFSLNKKMHYPTYSLTDELPFVSIVMAAHNEELVIEKKIDSIFSTNYPIDKIEVLIGSDCSTDSTNDIVRSKLSKHHNIYFVEFDKRQGKISIINQLVDQANGKIIISTDANVFHTPETIFNLVKFFKCEEIGLVDTQMVNTGLDKKGISIQESSYITREVSIKNREGLLWGTMIGPFGGCYAVRKDCYHKTPANHIVDDFYVNMTVLEMGKKTISSAEAVVYEDVSNLIREEFRRKVRISMGNFQNLKRFNHLLWPPYKPVAFAFLSHKIIRWFGPLLIITALLSSVYLAFSSKVFLVTLVVQLFLYSLPLIDIVLKSINIHLVLLRFSTHFFSMNLALLIGLAKYLKGVKSNVWQPTQRNQ